MMLALKKTWILMKNYWWFPIGLCSAIIWVCTRHNKNKEEVLKFFKDDYLDKIILEVGTAFGHTTRMLSFIFKHFDTFSKKIKFEKIL